MGKEILHRKILVLGGNQPKPAVKWESEGKEPGSSHKHLIF